MISRLLKPIEPLLSQFRTPPYEDQTVTEDVNVFFELYRPSDNAYSEPKHFRYKPREEIRYVIELIN